MDPYKTDLQRAQKLVDRVWPVRDSSCLSAIGLMLLQHGLGHIKVNDLIDYVGVIDKEEKMSEQKSKNPDYTESAVNLNNSPELKDMLLVLRQKRKDIEGLESVLHETAEWKLIEELEAAFFELNDQIKKTIDRLGGFQSIDEGLYGLRQRRLSLSYIPKLVRTILPKLAEALIEEVVNKKVMDGMLKGGVVSQEQSEACAERTEVLAYIIRT